MKSFIQFLIEEGAEYWREKDGPIPKDYDYVEDPLHGKFEFEDKSEKDLVSKIGTILDRYIKDINGDGPKVDVDRQIAILKSEWAKKGGTSERFNQLVAWSFAKSSFYKKMSKNAKASQKPETKKQEKPKPKFNAIDLRNIKL